MQMKSYAALFFAFFVAGAAAFAPSTGRVALASRQGWAKAPRPNNQVGQLFTVEAGASRSNSWH